MNRELEDLKEEHSKLQEILKDCDPFDKFFSHDILLYEPEHKKFLAQTLEDRYNSPVSHTKLICKLDPLNKINFHKYLDEVPCLMIIAHL